MLIPLLAVARPSSRQLPVGEFHLDPRTRFLTPSPGQTHGFTVEDVSDIQYQGIPSEIMHKDFRGEVIYNAETDVHFPNLTVGQTLSFAAKARVPRTRIGNVSREAYAEHLRDLVMAIFGLTHTLNTKVGNDFIRGVSGGERKRVSIAETTLSGTFTPFHVGATFLIAFRLATSVLGQLDPWTRQRNCSRFHPYFASLYAGYRLDLHGRHLPGISERL